MIVAGSKGRFSIPFRGRKRGLTIMRKLTSLITILAGLCMAVGCTKVEEKKPIRISINVWPGYAHAFVAQEKGFFAKNNVKAELILKRDISESKKLYDSGRVDGLFNVFPDVIMLNSNMPKGRKPWPPWLVDLHTISTTPCLR